ncbi:MAG: family 10 glycosylhydrolase [Lentisphaeria bacterium]
MMKKIPILLVAMFSPLMLISAESKVKIFVSWHDNAEENFSSLPSGEMKHARRTAFPMKGRALVIDTLRPVTAAKIILPLTKLSLKSPEMLSEAGQSRVYAGNDPQNLLLVEAALITVEAKEVEGVLHETVVITGLPEARYYQIHAPRTKVPYVFGLEDAFKLVEVHTAALAEAEAASVQYPDVKDMDFSLDQVALPIAGCGFRDHGNEALVASDPVLPEGGTAQIGWPWRHRSVGFILEQAASVGKIVFTLEKMQMQRPEMTTGLEKAQVFASKDNQNFSRIIPQVDTQLYRNGDKLFARVTLSGTFTGKYFRAYAPWENNFYVFGSRRLNTSIKAFSSATAQARSFSVPLSANKSFPVNFVLSGCDTTKGEAAIYVDGQEKPLWQADFSQLKADTSNMLMITPDHWAPGIRKLQLVIREENNEFPQTLEQCLRFHAGDLLLSPENIKGFTATEELLGSEKTRFLTAESKGATLEYSVPAAGDYALYIMIKGEGQIKVTTRDIANTLGLQLWHPGNTQNNLAGENFVGAARLEATDKISITAINDAVSIGNVKLSPIDTKRLAIYQAAPDIRPAAIIHADGYSDFYAREVTPEELRRRIDQYQANHAFAYDWCVGTTAVNYPSKVATPFGQQRDVVYWRNGDRLAGERLEKLLSAGHDPVQILRNYSREKGFRLSLTQRAGAYYSNEKSRSMNAQFFIDHPEFYQVDTNGRTWEKPSYAYPEVRQFYLDMIREMAAYKPDAITIEFLRHPPYFRYDKPLIDEYIKRHGKCEKNNYLDDKWQKIQCDIMTAHIQEIRRILAAADAKIQLEISFDWHDYYKQGIDLQTILELGLVDLISPGIYHVGKQKYFPVQPFAEMVRHSPRKVLIFPRVEATIYGGDPTPEEEKGLIKIERRNLSVPMFQQLFITFLQEGADGIRPFNTGGAWLSQTLADRSGLKRFQTFVLPLLDLRITVE